MQIIAQLPVLIVIGKDLVVDVTIQSSIAVVTSVARVVKMEDVVLKNHMMSVQPMVVFGLKMKQTVAQLTVIFVRVVLETVVHF